MWKVGLQTARNSLRESLYYQLIEASTSGIISQKVIILINFTEHAYYGKRDDKMIKVEKKN